ncbi:uncharacterized protein KIAA0895-like [Megalops cyprinoides]|uniref:uncharacterized protein KIAA0895-like n=1 Tax=Megalops cyprinoides TaxID=118141 RepID=UPI001863AA79|nr:uncharacterized protein KIAA0895-like [Megalops cyprinoides]
MERPTSPSQVFLEQLQSGVLKDLFTTGTSTFNVHQHGREGEDGRDSRSPRKSRTPRLLRASVVHRSEGCPPHGDPLLGHPRESLGSRQGRGLAVMGRSLDLSPRLPAHSADCPLLVEGSAAYDTDSTALQRRLCIFSAVKPSNVEAEKTKFFMSNFTYNPQFEYSHRLPPTVQDRYSDASDTFLTQAVRILEQALQKYGSYERFERATGGNLVSKKRIRNHVKKYMEKEGCLGEIAVHLTEDLLSRASMTVVNSRPTLTINVSMAREYWLEGMLRHEIGTHYLRGMNNSQQPWSSGVGRRRYELKHYNPTEEGLASLHSVLFRKDPTLWRAALLYYTVYQASRLSFSRLFQDLGRFVQDPHTRWDYCIRAKRGQTDTALPGCFSKDQVYLDGVVRLLRYREHVDFQLLMALGKVSYEDVDRLRDLAFMEHVRIPHFLQDRARYHAQLCRIMEVNQLTDGELRKLI